MSELTQAPFDTREQSQSNGQPSQAEPPAVQSSGESEHLHKIFDLEDEVQNCELDYDLKAEAAKSAKKRLEAAQDSLNRFIRSLQEKLPLFDKPAPEAKAEPWRDVPIREALTELSDAIFDTFEESAIFTVGHLCSYRVSNQLADLPGIGPAKVTKIEDALERFWGSLNKEGVQDADTDQEARGEDLDRA